MGNHALVETAITRIFTKFITQETGCPGVSDKTTPRWFRGTGTDNFANHRTYSLRRCLALVSITP